MSIYVIDDDIRLKIAQSLSVVERHRDAIAARMQEHMAAMEAEDTVSEQAGIATMMLVELLLDGARDLTAFASTRDLSFAASEHRRLDIDGRHYARFNVALAPVLREVVEPTLPRAIVAGWCDAFGFLVRQLRSSDRRTSRPRRTLRLR